MTEVQRGGSVAYICRDAINSATDSTSEALEERAKNRLRTLSDRLDRRHVFTKGQFVKWKPGLKNRKYPDYGEPVIVMGVLTEPVFDLSESSSASPYFQEPLTLIIGTHQDEDLLEFRVDGRRFEPFS